MTANDSSSPLYALICNIAWALAALCTIWMFLPFPRASEPQRDVTFQVSGTTGHTVSVMWNCSIHNIQLVSGKGTLPFSVTRHALVDDGVHLSATDETDPNSPIACRILIDGKLFGIASGKSKVTGVNVYSR